MDERKRKMTAPIVVTVILILYYIAYFSFIISLLGGVFRFVLGIIPLIFAVLIIKVCIDRIKEIKKGEEDDISKY